MWRNSIPASSALTWFSHYVDADGLLNNPPHWIFVDWAEVDKRGQISALNAQYVRALEMSAELVERIGLSGHAEGLRAQAEAVKAAINRYLWDDARGVYADARLDGVQSRCVSQQSNGLCLSYGNRPGRSS